MYNSQALSSRWGLLSDPLLPPHLYSTQSSKFSKIERNSKLQYSMISNTNTIIWFC